MFLHKDCFVSQPSHSRKVPTTVVPSGAELLAAASAAARGMDKSNLGDADDDYDGDAFAVSPVSPIAGVGGAMGDDVYSPTEHACQAMLMMPMPSGSSTVPPALQNLSADAVAAMVGDDPYECDVSVSVVTPTGASP